VLHFALETAPSLQELLIGKQEIHGVIPTNIDKLRTILCRQRLECIEQRLFICIWQQMMNLIQHHGSNISILQSGLQTDIRLPAIQAMLRRIASTGHWEPEQAFPLGPATAQVAKHVCRTSRRRRM